MSVFFNLSSLVLGLAAWMLAILAVIYRKPHTAHRFSAASFALCIFSLLLQLFEIGNRVNIGDFSAIMDTIRAVILASCVLASVTVILNAIAFIKNRKTNCRENM